MMKLNPRVLFSFLVVVISCRSIEHPKCSNQVITVIAHPDDETLICGTLAKLVARGCDVTMVYITSGDDGPDKTGQHLYGNALAAMREKEVQKSLDLIGIINPPRFLKFPDSHVAEYTREIKDTLVKIFQRLEPEIVITFGPDGVTDDPDHITTGYIRPGVRQY